MFKAVPINQFKLMSVEIQSILLIFPSNLKNATIPQRRIQHQKYVGTLHQSHHRQVHSLTNWNQLLMKRIMNTY